MTAAYVEDTSRARPRPARRRAARDARRSPEIVALIEALIDGGHAYESGGDVYFRVRSFDGYGKLSNRDPDEMDQGEEAGSAELKEEPARLRAVEGAQGGRGRLPGPRRGARGARAGTSSARRWRRSELGPDFAIHGGGSDLVFPHHENEIAQTEAARGLPFARIWMHNGMIRTAEEKMSKSVGNIFQLSEAVDRFGPEAVVAYLSSGHYRQPLEFSEQALAEARARLDRIRNFLHEAPRGGEEDEFVAGSREEFPRRASRRLQHPARMGRRVRTRRRGQPACRSPARTRRLPSCSPLLGLDSLLEPPGDEADAEALQLLEAREAARAERDFAKRRRDPRPSSPSSAGRSGTRPRARGSCDRVAEQWPTSQIIYGRRAVAEAGRGRRAVRRTWTSADEGAAELDPNRRLARPSGDRRRGRSLSRTQTRARCSLPPMRSSSCSIRFRIRTTSAPSVARRRRPAPPEL